MSEEVKSLSNQVEKLLDEVQLDGVNANPSHPEAWSPIVSVAKVLAELAKAHAIVELADAIRESCSSVEVKLGGTATIIRR